MKIKNPKNQFYSIKRSSNSFGFGAFWETVEVLNQYSDSDMYKATAKPTKEATNIEF